MSQTSSSHFHLLLIEDDPAVARSLKDGLEREGYGVTWCNSGVEGITVAREQPPHLIILDVRLPDGLGFDVCRQMRKLGLRQPILMLTARQEELDKVLGLEMGADDYVTKPYSLRELVSRIRAHLRRAYGEFSSVDADLLYAQDLTIDRARGQVRRGDETIPLTPIEFRLLVYLAQHTGQALTRAQILDAVWGYAADVESEKIVNVELDPSRPALILTVPGIGYRLVG